MRVFTAAAIVLAAYATQGAEMRVQRDIQYGPAADPHQTLDVYAPQEGQNHPVVVWIHGGGWRKGDKASVGRKPQVLVDKGFVLCSINYRFIPDVTIKQMMGDVAKAIAWIHNHAGEFGGDPNRLIVMGHSAGAHLAALVCTDSSYLKAEGLTLSLIKGCMPVDVSVYDIPKRLADGPVNPNFASPFAATDEELRDLSPAAHVEKGRYIPPFLILHVADRPETKVQSEHFADVLRKAGVKATVFAGEGKTHGTINNDLGLPDDPPTQAMYGFLDEILK